MNPCCLSLQKDLNHDQNTFEGDINGTPYYLQGFLIPVFNPGKLEVEIKRQTTTEKEQEGFKLAFGQALASAVQKEGEEEETKQTLETDEGASNHYLGFRHSMLAGV